MDYYWVVGSRTKEELYAQGTSVCRRGFHVHVDVE